MTAADRPPEFYPEPDSYQPVHSRPVRPGWLRLTVVLLTALLASGGTLLGTRALAGDRDPQPRTVTPPTTLDARTASSAEDPAPGQGGGVPGSTRLSVLGPVTLHDGRRAGATAAGAQVAVTMPELPPASVAVLLEVSLLGAAAPGAVTVGSGADQLTALRAARAGASNTATAVVAVGSDRLSVRTEGGGRLVVTLIGAFEPAVESTSGRIVAVPPTQVLRLVPRTDGKDATIDLSGVPALRQAGTVSAVLLQVAADVGPRGGFVAVGSSPARRDQSFYWSATSGADRTRTGLLVVPVSGASLALHYEAGTLLTADVVGYVTDMTAPADVAGLVVPLRPRVGTPVAVPARGATDVVVLPADDPAGVAPDQVASALVGVVATGAGPGPVTVFRPGGQPPARPVLFAAPGPPRATSTLVPTASGAVRVASPGGAQVTVVAQALVLAGA